MEKKNRKSDVLYCKNKTNLNEQKKTSEKKEDEN